MRWRLLEKQPFDVVLTDLRMEKVDGMQILKSAAKATRTPKSS